MYISLLCSTRSLGFSVPVVVLESYDWFSLVALVVNGLAGKRMAAFPSLPSPLPLFVSSIRCAPSGLG